MTNQSTGANGQPLFDDAYPLDYAVDLNLISNYAGGILASASTNGSSPSFMDLSSGWSYDSPAGLNAVVTIGALHIVHIALYNSTATAIGTTIAGMKPTHRPYQPIFVGATIVDGSSFVTGTAYMAANGAIGVESLIPDVSSDSKFNGLRATFFYVATS